MMHPRKDDGIGRISVISTVPTFAQVTILHTIADLTDFDCGSGYFLKGSPP